MRGLLTSVNISPGGMPKIPVPFVMVTTDGLAGDWQKNRKYHGGPDRAVCLFSEELYAWLRESGIALNPGEYGENFTTRGIDLMALEKGARLQISQCVIELTSIRKPCRSLDQWDKRLMEMVKGRSGWLAKVVTGGMVKPGDELSIL